MAADSYYNHTVVVGFHDSDDFVVYLLEDCDNCTCDSAWAHHCSRNCPVGPYCWLRFSTFVLYKIAGWNGISNIWMSSLQFLRIPTQDKSHKKSFVWCSCIMWNKLYLLKGKHKLIITIWDHFYLSNTWINMKAFYMKMIKFITVPLWLIPKERCIKKKLVLNLCERAIKL